MNRRLSALLCALLSLAAGCRNQPWVEGGLYSVNADEGGFAVVKVLKLDDAGVHVAMYSNLYADRPAHVDSKSLFFGRLEPKGKGMAPKKGEGLGMGHLPLSRKSFAGWGAELIKVEPVTAAELDGYEMWKEGGGGYF